MKGMSHLRCRWPGCDRRAKVAWWGCLSHWYRLPLYLRMTLLRAFTVGREHDCVAGHVQVYNEAEREIRNWIDQAELPNRKAA